MFFSILLNATLLAGATGLPDPNTPYIPAREREYNCTVQKVLSVDWPHDMGTSSGIFLKVKSQRHEYTVIVAPQWHLGSYMTFRPGDSIIVRGAAGTGKVIVARWIRKNNRTLHLRTATGVPHWESFGSAPVKKRQGRKGRGKGRRGAGGKGSFPGM